MINNRIKFTLLHKIQTSQELNFGVMKFVKFTSQNPVL